MEPSGMTDNDDPPSSNGTASTSSTAQNPTGAIPETSILTSRSAAL